MLISANTISNAQSVLNGSFELNHAIGDQINLNNSDFNLLMDSVNAFGFAGNLDIIESDAFCGSSAFEGDWYVALTGGATDEFSMQLDNPLTVGNTYVVSFYDRYCIPYPSWTGQVSLISVGLSTNDSTFGNLLHSTTSQATNVWTQRTFSFTATSAGQFLTVHLNTGSLTDTWVQVDAFSIESGTSGLEHITKNNSGILIYPNPANDFISLSDKINAGSVRIYDAYGKLVLNKVLSNNSKINERISLSGISSGVYFIQISCTDNRIITERLVKTDY
ncbi:MAG: T9SS type A sorting domain-containing protein [Bacteroidia bacterium]